MKTYEQMETISFEALPRNYTVNGDGRNPSLPWAYSKEELWVPLEQGRQT